MTPSALQTHPPMGKFKGYVGMKTDLNRNIMQLYFSMIHSFAWLVIKKSNLKCSSQEVKLSSKYQSYHLEESSGWKFFSLVTGIKRIPCNISISCSPGTQVAIRVI